MSHWKAFIRKNILFSVSVVSFIPLSLTSKLSSSSLLFIALKNQRHDRRQKLWHRQAFYWKNCSCHNSVHALCVFVSSSRVRRSVAQLLGRTVDKAPRCISAHLSYAPSQQLYSRILYMNKAAFKDMQYYETWPTHLHEHGVNSAVACHAGGVSVQSSLDCNPPRGAVDLKVLIIPCNDNIKQLLFWSNQCYRSSQIAPTLLRQQLKTAIVSKWIKVQCPAILFII